MVSGWTRIAVETDKAVPLIRAINRVPCLGLGQFDSVCDELHFLRK